jgi:hypothetical protein
MLGMHGNDFGLPQAAQMLAGSFLAASFAARTALAI